jgi:hypothetical protein
MFRCFYCTFVPFFVISGNLIRFVHATISVKVQHEDPTAVAAMTSHATSLIVGCNCYILHKSSDKAVIIDIA